MADLEASIAKAEAAVAALRRAIQGRNDRGLRMRLSIAEEKLAQLQASRRVLTEGDVGVTEEDQER